MKYENYIKVEFPSKSANEGFAGRQRGCLPPSWTQPWRSWGILKPR